MHTFCIMHHALCSMHIYAHTHTHTCTRYLSTVHAILCMYACLVCWTLPYEWLGTGNKRREEREAEKKDANASAAAYCTVLHCTARSRCRLASPRLASHCIASLRPVKLIPTSYLYFLGGSAGQSPRRLLTLHYLYVA